MSARKSVYGYVASRLESIQRMGKNEARASLAKLRRGVGHKPGELPELMGMFLIGMPEEMMRDPLQVNAVYTALTLFAMHQQGHDVSSQFMSSEKKPFGAAVAALVTKIDERERVQNRFSIMATSRDMVELSNHMRGVVQQLSASGIPLDYPALAVDLLDYQIQDRVSKVRLLWGQDFYGALNKREKEEETKDE